MHAGRRKFMKTSFLGLAGLGIAAPFVIKSRVIKRMTSSYFNHCPFEDSSVAVADDVGLDPVVGVEPIAEVAQPQQRDFAGDHPTRAHRALWDKANYLKSKGGIPAPTETTQVVVVGGGISGLTAAYSVQDLKPILLEQAQQFGGNAKAERWEGSNYSIGAAYINVPEAGSPIDKMLKDLGIQPQFRSETGKDEAVTMNGKFSFPFWQGVTDPPRAAEFKKVFDKLISMATDEDAIPSIPPAADETAEDRAELVRLDNMSMQEWVKATFGEVHPHIEELFPRILLVGVLHRLHRSFRRPGDQLPLRGSRRHSNGSRWKRGHRPGAVLEAEKESSGLLSSFRLPCRRHQPGQRFRSRLLRDAGRKSPNHSGQSSDQRVGEVHFEDRRFGSFR